MTLRTRRHEQSRLYVLAGLGVASAVCLGLLELRAFRYGVHDFDFLIWNLVLAWVPLVLALLVYDTYRRGTPLVRLVPAVVLWLLFLPNAPYILTDFVHLSAARPVPLWFDGLVLSAFAWTGVLLGFVSLYLLHAVARHRFGSPAAWAGVVSVLGIVSAGVCLGRFLRWNSWDLLVSPGRSLGELFEAADPAALARGFAVTLVLTCGLAAAYLTFYALLGARLDRRDWPPAGR